MAVSRSRGRKYKSSARPTYTCQPYRRTPGMEHCRPATALRYGRLRSRERRLSPPRIALGQNELNIRAHILLVTCEPWRYGGGSTWARGAGGEADRPMAEMPVGECGGIEAPERIWVPRGRFGSVGPGFWMRSGREGAARVSGTALPGNWPLVSWTADEKPGRPEASHIPVFVVFPARREQLVRLGVCRHGHLKTGST